MLSFRMSEVVTRMQNPSIEQCLMEICELGCTRVSEIIATLEQGRRTPETDGLLATERAQVLTELKAIMAIYDTRKGGCA